MKKIMTIVGLMFMLTVMSRAQERLMYGVQVNHSFTHTQYSEVNATIGFHLGETDEMSVGPLYRRLYGEIGHSNDYYGGTLYAQTGVLNPLLIFLKTDFVYGNWYKADRLTSKIFLKKGVEPMPTVGVGYLLNKNINVTIGYTYFVYNPKEYVENQTNPFQNHGVVLGLKYSIYK